MSRPAAHCSAGSGRGRLLALAAALIAGGTAACSSDTSYGSAANGAGPGAGATTRGRAAAAGSGTSGGSSSGTGGSATSASSSSTAGSGTTSGAGASTGSTTGCPPLDAPLTDCPPGQVELRVAVYDAFTSTLVTDTVTFTDVLNPGFQAQSSCGQAVLCRDPGALVAIRAVVPSYAPAIYADIQATYSRTYDNLTLLNQQLLGSQVGSLNDPPFDSSAPSVFLRVITRGNRNCSRSGWGFELHDLDGGPVAGTAAYLVATGFQYQGPTADPGYAIFYNVDPTVSELRVVGFYDGGIPDDAGPCAYDGGEQEFTGVLHMQPGYTTLIPYNVY